MISEIGLGWPGFRCPFDASRRLFPRDRAKIERLFTE